MGFNSGFKGLSIPSSVASPAGPVEHISGPNAKRNLVALPMRSPKLVITFRICVRNVWRKVLPGFAVLIDSDSLVTCPLFLSFVSVFVCIVWYPTRLLLCHGCIYGLDLFGWKLWFDTIRTGWCWMVLSNRLWTLPHSLQFIAYTSRSTYVTCASGK